jgi:signal peptidase I
MDNYGFNQHLSRHLQPVRDVGLACHMRLSWGGGQLVFRIHDGHDWYRVELLPDENLGRLRRADAILANFSLPPAAYCRQVLFEVAICDRQLLFGVDKRWLVQYGDISPDPPVTGPACPLGIGISRMEARLTCVQVLRDLHYLDPRGLGIAWESPRPMGASDYFVVGDNVPLSVDSRHWATPGVPRKLLLGRVLDP